MLEFNFIVTGLKYNTDKLPVSFKPGTIVELDNEITNQKDSDAIRIWVQGKKIGYVPNSGEFCKSCFTKVKKGYWNCSSCGASSENFVSGGIASQIINSGILNKPHVAVMYIVEEKRIIIKLMETSEEEY
jgi:hypothetical protein